MIARGVLLLSGLLLELVEWVWGLTTEIADAFSSVLEKAEVQRILLAAVAIPAVAFLFCRTYARQIDTAARCRGRYRRLAGDLEQRYRALRRRG